MRILMVSDVYFPRINGVSTAIETYRRTLAGEGIDVRLVAPAYGPPCDQGWITRVPARSVPRDPEDRLAHWGAFAREAAAAARDCDLVHVQTPFLAHYAGVRAARRAGVPVLATYHTLFEEYLHHYAPLLPAAWLRGLARRFSRRQCADVARVIVPSRAIHERLAAYGVRTPCSILPTGVPLERFAAGDRARFRAAHGIAPERPVALYVGRVAFEKNIGFLIDAVARARKPQPDLLFLVSGEGPAVPALRRQVAAAGLSDAVRFLGYLDRARELPDCYAAADVFVFASRTETQGLVLVEAMAMGLPVVALAAMGTADILAGCRGACVPRDDVDDFAAALAGVLADPGRRAELAGEARIHARRWDEWGLAARLAALYREVARTHAAPRRAPA